LCGKAAQNTHHNHPFYVKEFSEKTTKECLGEFIIETKAVAFPFSITASRY
jgi:pyrroloquinoline quinone (PQQ) biosynthesis protein C